MNTSTLSTPRAPFRVTFDTVTYESAENGEAERSGFCDSAGYEYTREDFATWKDWQDFEPPQLTLREAIHLAGGPFEDSGRWFTTTDATEDYATGARTTYSIHPPHGISAASYSRLARLLKANR